VTEAVRTPFRPALATTGVGSLPHLAPGEGVEDVLAHCPEYPYWPQLPRLSVREDMYRQFSAGLPGLRVSVRPPARDGREARETAEGEARLEWRRDECVPAELERVYAAALLPEAAPEAWALSPGDARGLWALREALTRRGERGLPAGLKGQATGPLSLGLAVTGEGGRALLYEEDLMDGVVRGLALRARWQERFLEALLEPGLERGGPDAPNGPVSGSPGRSPPRILISVDEPYLGTFGSAFFPYRPETVLGYLRVFDDVLEGHWGLHCCANTDWELVLGSPVRFVSFDAYAHGERLVLYPAAVRDFLEAGKTLLWGIVPSTAQELVAESGAGLVRRLSRLFETLVARGVPERALVRQAMITPACGLAGLTVPDARRAMRLALEVSGGMQEQWGGTD